MWERWAERDELARLSSAHHKANLPPEILEREKQLKETENKAAQLIESAKQESRKLMEVTLQESENLKKRFIDEAELQSADIRESAYSKGYEQGSEKGEKEGKIKGNEKGVEQFAAIIEKWEGMILKVLVDKKELMEKAEPTLVTLASDIAEKIIDASLPLDKEIVIRQVQKSLKEVVEREWIRIRVYPDDILEVRAYKPKFLSEMDAKEIEIVEDASVGRGGCVIETPSGNIDARLKTQISRINEHLEH